MNTPLLTLKIRSQRDVLMARQRARQVAGVLGYEPREQTFIAAAVFEIARSALRPGGRSTLTFHTDYRALHVRAARSEPPVRKGLSVQISRWLIDRLLCEPGYAAGAVLRLEKPLPKQGPTLSGEDAAWAVQHLTEMTPFDVVAELQQQNREMLQLYQDLQARQAELTQIQTAAPQSAAA